MKGKTQIRLGLAAVEILLAVACLVASFDDRSFYPLLLGYAGALLLGAGFADAWRAVRRPPTQEIASR